MLAFSLHELARVLGMEQTCSDILPIFEDSSTKDCDDVKIGTLTHLTEFCEVSIVVARGGGGELNPDMTRKGSMTIWGGGEGPSPAVGPSMIKILSLYVVKVVKCSGLSFTLTRARDKQEEYSWL